MFSRRSAFERAPHALARAVALARARGRRLLDLTGTNPTQAALSTPDRVLAALADARGGSYEPHALGLPEARRAVASELSLGGARVAAEQVALVCSTSEAYSLAFRLLCDPGDRVLVGRPGYPLLEQLARADGVAIDSSRIGYHAGWHLDLADLCALAERGPRPRAVVCVHPNHPTGSFVSREEGRALAGLGLPLIGDEVFAAHALARPTPDPDRLPSLGDLAARVGGGTGAPLVITLGGLSKYAALPQLKLAWMVLAGPEAPEALARLEILADAYLSLATPVQLALPAIFEHARGVRAAIAARLERNRTALRDALAGSPATLLRGEGGWSAVVRLPATRSDDDWALALLDEHGVVVEPGWLYDFEGGPYAVVSLLVPEADLEEGARTLASLVTRGCPSAPTETPVDDSY